MKDRSSGGVGVGVVGGGNTFERVLTSKEKAALAGARFSSLVLDGIDFAGADLRGANFERAVIADCDFSGADFRGARLILCELRNVLLGNALFGANRFDGTTFVDVHGLSAEDRAAIAICGGTFLQAHASLR
jgi:uncharacterized protein YjbI with pentapeptide repeats